MLAGYHFLNYCTLEVFSEPRTDQVTIGVDRQSVREAASDVRDVL
jgi:hypothetical protein